VGGIYVIAMDVSGLDVYQGDINRMSFSAGIRKNMLNMKKAVSKDRVLTVCA